MQTATGYKRGGRDSDLMAQLRTLPLSDSGGAYTADVSGARTRTGLADWTRRGRGWPLKLATHLVVVDRVV